MPVSTPSQRNTTPPPRHDCRKNLQDDIQTQLLLAKIQLRGYYSHIQPYDSRHLKADLDNLIQTELSKLRALSHFPDGTEAAQISRNTPEGKEAIDACTDLAWLKASIGEDYTPDVYQCLTTIAHLTAKTRFQEEQNTKNR